MCDGNYLKDPCFVATHRERFTRKAASYLLRGRYRRILGDCCVYCGFKAETGDHVPSLFAGYTNGVKNGVVVPVCTDCHRELGAFSSTCFKERLQLLGLVFDKLADKNQRWASNPNSGSHWAEKEEKFRKKASRCRERMNCESCCMLEWQ